MARADYAAWPVGTAVSVRWDDAHGGAVTGWSHLADVKFDLAQIQSIGLLVRVTPKAIFVASDHDPATDAWYGISAIPRANITAIRKLT